LGQVIACAQLLVAPPHALPLHAAVLFGAQQVWLVKQTPALGQVGEQLTACPQWLVAVVLHWPAHAVASSGVQHDPSGLQTSELDAQDVRPFAPHAIVWPQLLVAVPHAFPLHVMTTDSGAHPHAPLVQVAPPSQTPHSTGCPQLSVLEPQRFWHQVAVGVGEQQVWLDVQTPPLGQVAGQVTVRPQRLVTVTPHFPAHATASVSGVQQEPSAMQTSPVDEQAVDPVAPQATTCPQLLVAEPQFLPAQVVVAGSAVQPQAPLAVQVAPASHS